MGEQNRERERGNREVGRRGMVTTKTKITTGSQDIDGEGITLGATKRRVLTQDTNERGPEVVLLVETTKDTRAIDSHATMRRRNRPPL